MNEIHQLIREIGASLETLSNAVKSHSERLFIINERVSNIVKVAGILLSQDARYVTLFANIDDRLTVLEKKEKTDETD